MIVARLFLRRDVQSPSLNGLHATDELLSVFDIRSISTPALLFQTDYLTIQHSEVKDGQRHYRLGYSGREVCANLDRHPLAALAPPPPEHDNQANDAARPPSPRCRATSAQPASTSCSGP